MILCLTICCSPLSSPFHDIFHPILPKSSEYSILRIIINFYTLSFPPSSIPDLDTWIGTLLNEIVYAIHSSSFSTPVSSYYSWWTHQLKFLKSHLNYRSESDISQYQVLLLLLYAIWKHVPLRHKTSIKFSGIKKIYFFFRLNLFKFSLFSDRYSSFHCSNFNL